MDLDSVYTGDCLELFPAIPTGSVDLVFADPPFNNGEKYDRHHDRMPRPKYVAWCRLWVREIARVLKPQGTAWIAIGLEYEPDLHIILRDGAGLHFRDRVVWHYTFGVNCTKKLTRAHTPLLHFTKHPSRFAFNTDAIREPSARQLVYKDRRANPAGRLPDNVWQFSRVCGTFKERRDTPNQMPERLLGRIILACSNPGDLVLDPFAGSGTTLVVAKKLDRRFVGFELSPDYAEDIEASLAQANRGDPLAGSTAEPQRSRCR